MEYIIFFLFVGIPLSLIVIWFGGKREIGSKKTFWITLFLSPFVGLVAVLLSNRKNTEKYDYLGELLKITQLKESKIISELEFEREKNKIAQSRYLYENPVPDRAGFYYYIILIVVIFVGINLIGLLLTMQENKESEKPKSVLHDIF